MSNLVLFSGCGNNELSQKLADKLDVVLGRVSIQIADNKEITVNIDDIVRNKDVFIIQIFGEEINDMLMILLMMIDACKRAGAVRVTAVIPYYPYASQDKIENDQTSVAAKLVADMLVSSGVDYIITMELHCPQIHGFFAIPRIVNLSVETEQLRWIKENIPEWKEICLLVIDEPEVIELNRATAIANHLEVELMFMHNKGRNIDSDVASLVICGNVKDRPCVIVDCTHITKSEIFYAAKKLSEAGAKNIYALVTHGELSRDAISRINESCLDAVITTNTLPQEKNKIECPSKIQCIDVSSILAEAIRKMCSAL